MEFIGLIGLIGLLGFFGKSGFNEKVDELKNEFTKNNEQVETRVKNVEKIAVDANRKAQDVINDNQHYATKIDTQNLSERLNAIENSSGGNLNDKIDALQKNSDEITQTNSLLLQRVDVLEGKKFDDAIQKLFDRFRVIAENCRTFDENFKVIANSIKNLDDDAKTFDERLKSIEDQPKPEVDESAQIERLNTLEEDQKDLTQKLTDYNAALQKHHVVLVQWQNNFVAIQNHFNTIQATFEEHKKAFEALQSRLSEQEKSIGDFKATLDAQAGSTDSQQNIEKVIGDFQSKFDAQVTLIDSSKQSITELEKVFGDFQTKFDAQSSLIDSSKQSITELEKVIGDFQSKFDAQEKVIDEFKTKSDAQSSLIDSVQKNIGELEKVFESLKGKTYLTIENFDIKPTGRIFFTNKPDEVFQHLKIASNLTGITSFLESSDFEKKENFIRIVENYRQNLKKVSDKVRRKKFNEDALSEEVTDAFFNTLSKFFLATIPISIYRGARQETLEALDDETHETEFKFYSTFLTKINEYLAACQVYTVPILPKNAMTSEDIDRMSVTRKETSNESEDNVIDEVERLPYYMDYVTEGGEVETFASEGKMVVLKFDGDAK